MAAITGLGLGGPGTARAVFTAKSETAPDDPPATRITRLGIAGPRTFAGLFTDKADAGIETGLNYPIYTRKRKRR